MNNPSHFKDHFSEKKLDRRQMNETLQQQRHQTAEPIKMKQKGLVWALNLETGRMVSNQDPLAGQSAPPTAQRHWHGQGPGCRTTRPLSWWLHHWPKRIASENFVLFFAISIDRIYLQRQAVSLLRKFNCFIWKWTKFWTLNQTFGHFFRGVVHSKKSSYIPPKKSENIRKI